MPFNRAFVQSSVVLAVMMLGLTGCSRQHEGPSAIEDARLATEAYTKEKFAAQNPLDEAAKAQIAAATPPAPAAGTTATTGSAGATPTSATPSTATSTAIASPSSPATNGTSPAASMNLASASTNSTPGMAVAGPTVTGAASS